MKTALSILLILFILSGHEARAAEKFDISGFTIVSRTDPAYGSGVVKAWSVFFASKKDEETIVFYIVYFGKTQPLPELGQVCDIKGEWGRVNELVGNESQDIERGRIVARHQCKWPQAAAEASPPDCEGRRCRLVGPLDVYSGGHGAASVTTTTRCYDLALPEAVLQNPDAWDGKPVVVVGDAHPRPGSADTVWFDIKDRRVEAGGCGPDTVYVEKIEQVK